MRRNTIAFIFLALLAGGLLTAYAMDRERPEFVVAAALEHFKGVRSIAATSTMATMAPRSVLTGAEGDVIVPIVLTGNFAVTMPGAEPVRGTAAMTLVHPADAQSDVSIELIVSPDGSSYVQFGNLTPAEGSVLKPEDLNGKWFVMESPTLASMLLREQSDRIGDVAPNREPGTWARAISLATSGDLFGLPEKLGSKVLDGTPTWEFRLPVRKEVLVQLIAETKGIIRGSLVTEAEEKEIAAALEDRTVELKVWVAKKTKRFAQAELHVKTPDASGISRRLDLQVRFRDFDAPVTVSAPEGATPLSDVVAKLRR